MKTPFLLVAFAVSLCASAFTLIENGKVKPVVLAENAEESSKLAACEFTNYVARATGAALEVKVKGQGQQWNGKDSAVVIGTLKTLKDEPEAIKATRNYYTGQIDGKARQYDRRESRSASLSSPASCLHPSCKMPPAGTRCSVTGRICLF